MPIVVIVLAVARNAVHGELVGKRVFTVARVACLLRMRVIEGEPRIAIVIEARVIPTQWAVTITAFVAATPVVGVILGMASVAGCRRVDECVVGMAVPASRTEVLADQRVARYFVIELDLQPAVRRMTVAALRAEPAVVSIVVFVAGEAVGGCVAMSLFGLMAIAAPVVRVFAQQREVREIVIE